MKKPLQHTGGYTLVELVIAMALFSTMLVVITVGFLYAVKLYRSGLGARDTQSNARYGINELVRDSRLANTAVVAVDTVNSIGSGQHFDSVCLNLNSRTTRYFIDGPPGEKALVRVPHKPTILSTPIPNICNPADDLPGSREVLTSASVNVIELVATKIDGGLGRPQAIRFDMKLATYASRSNLVGTSCNVDTGSEYCSVIELVGTAALRGGEGTP